MRRYAGGIGCGARAGDERTPPSSRAAPGLRPQALGPAARSSLPAGPLGPREAQRRGCPKGAAPEGRRRGELVAGSAARRRNDAAMARREAPCTGDGACTRPNDAPLGAPSPRFFRGAESLSPQRRGRNTAYPVPHKEYGRWRLRARAFLIALRRRQFRAEPFAEREPFEIEGDIDRQPFAVRPVVERPRADRGVGIAVVVTGRGHGGHGGIVTIFIRCVANAPPPVFFAAPGTPSSSSLPLEIPRG